MIKKYIGNYKYMFIASVILTTISVAATLYQPTLLSDVVSSLTITDVQGNAMPDMDTINTSGMLLVIVGIIGLISGIFNTVIAAKVAQNVGADVREDAFKNIQKFALVDIEKFSTSNLVVRLTNDVTQVQNYVMTMLQLIIRVPLMFIGAFVLAISVFPGLWWTIVLYVVIVGLIMFIAMKSIGPTFKKLQTDIDSINGSVKENLDGVRVVKSFVTEKREESKFQKKMVGLTSHLLHISKTFAIIVPSFMFVANIITAFAIFYVAGKAVNDPTMIGNLVSFTTYMMQIMFAVVMLGFVSMILGRARVSIHRLNEILGVETSITYGEEVVSDDFSVEFKNVTFKYEDAEDITLKDINLSIKSGESIGIVGATGSGKSTLVNLIPRMYDPKEGEILIGGTNVKNLSHSSISSNISIVLQKAILLSGQIIDTIKEGNELATENEIIEASKHAQAFEFIDKKKQKFNSKVMQRGSNFSGGQKQRLSITRGFVKNPKILILDDSTSALDAKSENLVKSAISSEFQNTTKIIVAQKISSVIDLDRIVVMDSGRIVDIGTHDSLVKNSVVYQEIFNTQRGKGDVKNA